MPDTINVSLENTPCSDCREVGMVCMTHFGSLVPEGEVGNFCQECWRQRNEEEQNGLEPRPIVELVTTIPDKVGRKGTRNRDDLWVEL